MNTIVRQALAPLPPQLTDVPALEALTTEITPILNDLNACFARYRSLEDLKTRLTEMKGISQSVALESCATLPSLLDVGLRTYTVEVSDKNYVLALEQVEQQQSGIMVKIRAFIKKIIEFARDVFNRIKAYVESFFAVGENNKRNLNATQLLINQAVEQAKKPKPAMEGFSTGTIPTQAPKFLHLEYQRIIADTAKLEQLATAFIGSTISLLNLQFKHCKYVIEAYNKLMNSPMATLEEFDRTCQDIVQRITHEAHAFHTDMKAFDCVEIVESSENNNHAGVLKYRLSIKPPGQDKMAVEPVSYTTNLMRAQDLQDRLVKLNDHIVEFAKKIKGFFVTNSKTFLDTLNNLNDSAVRSPEGKFDAHSDYVIQVHQYLVRGNLIQVVLGLNTLNTVWRSVHQLNTRVVKEFMNS